MSSAQHALRGGLLLLASSATIPGAEPSHLYRYSKCRGSVFMLMLRRCCGYYWSLPVHCFSWTLLLSALWALGPVDSLVGCITLFTPLFNGTLLCLVYTNVDALIRWCFSLELVCITRPNSFSLADEIKIQSQLMQKSYLLNIAGARTGFLFHCAIM